MKSVKDQIKNWYNHTFFETDEKGHFIEPKPLVKLGLTLESDRGIIELPITVASRQDRLEDIIHDVCKKLDKGMTPEYYPLTPQEDKAVGEEPAEKQEAELTTVIYRNKEYDVKSYEKKGKQEYLIIRRDDGKIIGPEMKTHQHVIKLYLELVS